jgi:hypothetical protein
VEVSSETLVRDPQSGFYLYQSVILYEEISVDYTTIKPKYTFEDTVTPAWIDEAFFNAGIGALGGVYQRLFDCTAITDPIAFCGGANVSQEDAIDAIAFFYDRIQRAGMSATEFIESFTYRPIATFHNLLGRNMVLDPKSGTLLNSSLVIGSEDFIRSKLTAQESDISYQGFFTGSFGEGLKDLTGLVGIGLAGAQSLNSAQYATGSNHSKDVIAVLDVRDERAKAVKAYVKRLQLSGGALID